MEEGEVAVFPWPLESVAVRNRVTGSGVIGTSLYLVRTRVMPGIEYRCCRAACGSCVISKARWKQTEKWCELPIWGDDGVIHMPCSGNASFTSLETS